MEDFFKLLLPSQNIWSLDKNYEVLFFWIAIKILEEFQLQLQFATEYSNDFYPNSGSI